MHDQQQHLFIWRFLIVAVVLLFRFTVPFYGGVRAIVGEREVVVLSSLGAML